MILYDLLTGKFYPNIHPELSNSQMVMGVKFKSVIIRMIGFPLNLHDTHVRQLRKVDDSLKSFPGGGDDLCFPASCDIIKV